ncbi:MAG: hypothetical protein KZQ93_18415 [Candidatus Thiodiazotropha sp. (ex Monitilora ramsayi)]|nr:hypothetical protein [Candidatus Thiodiazotropha sp. (ex Monitilora ramsayi)]
MTKKQSAERLSELGNDTISFYVGLIQLTDYSLFLNGGMIRLIADSFPGIVGVSRLTADSFLIIVGLIRVIVDSFLNQHPVV